MTSDLTVNQSDVTFTQKPPNLIKQFFKDLAQSFKIKFEFELSPINTNKTTQNVAFCNV